MEELAGWIAPIATMIAAIMTASNLGPRVTGWGFVVFTVGSIAWVTVAVTTGQQNLLLANGFLTLVNLVGIWRWLGRVARYDAGAREAQARSTAADATLFPVGNLIDRPVLHRDGTGVGRSVGAMARCDGGGIAYLVVAEGGIGGVGERLHAMRWEDVTIRGETLSTSVDAAALAALPEVDPTRWPAAAPRRAA
ncbi:PRC-barrel domain containing protein [Sphingomonas solaris]|uniref:PRC-barrel domain containing protein n=1 Tax=Alterirhizorhabdus solaris TaxID=2529389 RepID=A0A558R2T1_9SPHN|nr:PRC-barrel domain containing protein [Sphingomonas solaris]TVV73695.1 PRC-barrel domain containing protein [Sphingomonas solaris]